MLAGCGRGLCVYPGWCHSAPELAAISSQTAIDFGSRTFSTEANSVLTLTNTGRMLASELILSTPTSPFTFAGGNYPGTNGTCGTTLEPQGSCTVILAYQVPAPPVASHAGQATLTYFNGAETKSYLIDLSGASDNGTFLVSRGLSGYANFIRVVGSRIWVGGQIDSYNSSPAPKLAVFDSSYELDNGFNAGTGFNDEIYSLAEATDGSGDVYVGGLFTSYGGTTNTDYLVRLNSDGSVDTGFNVGTGPNSWVNSVVTAPDASGDVYLGGQFTNYNVTSGVNYIVRVNSDGSRDAGFASGTGFNNTVSILAASTDGSQDIYVGGSFVSYDGTAGINRIIRLNSDGSRDVAFATGTGFNNQVTSLAVANDGSGDLYVGGNFVSFNGTPGLNYIARLNSDGSLDAGFVTGTGFTDLVYAVAVAIDGSGDVYVGGEFDSYNGTTGVNRIIRLNSDGTRDIGFNTLTGFDARVETIEPATDGSADVFIGGYFTAFRGETGVTKIVRVNSDGTRQAAFSTSLGFDGDVLAIQPLADGSGDSWLAGAFTSFAGTSSINRLLRVNSDGSRDTSLNAGTAFDGSVNAITPAADGSGDYYLGGAFTSFNGVGAINRIVRLNSDGSRDSGFNTGTGFNTTVEAIVMAQDASGDVYAGGLFDTYNATPALNRLIRINSNGSRDTGFAIGTGFNGHVLALAAATDGSQDVYAAGDFGTYNGTPGVNRIIRLNNDGSRDVAFATGTGAPSRVNTVALANDGSGDVYAGGEFSSFNGTPGVNYIIRLNSDGSRDMGFATGTGFNGFVHFIAPANDGSGDVYVGGAFSTFNGSSNINRIVRLNSDGSIDSAFATGTGFNGVVEFITFATDGTADLLFGGGFTAYHGTTQDKVTRLSNTGLAD